MEPKYTPHHNISNILLISNMNDKEPSKHGIQSKKEMLYDILKNSKINCKLKIGSLNIINDFNELSLLNYDCIIYDLLDYGCEIQNPTEILENYVRNGGKILATHDHILFGLHSIFGLEASKNQIRMFYEAVNVCYEHEIWKSYYNLENLKTIKVCTHNNYNINNYNEVIQLMHSNDNYNDLYLSLRNLGMGKVIYWNAGHSTDLSEDERKLFLNIMAYILK